MEDTLVIVSEKYRKKDSEKEVYGVTVMVDGLIKEAFDKIKIARGYTEYNQVLRDVVIEGVSKIILDSKQMGN